MIKRREIARERKRNGSIQFFHGSSVEDEAIASGQRGLEREKRERERDLGQASLTAHPLRSSFVIDRSKSTTRSTEAGTLNSSGAPLKR